MESTATAAQPLINPAPGPQHAWLQKLLGDWIVVGPDGEPDAAHSDWTERVRSVGGLWIVAEGTGSMPDGVPAVMMMTLGYDARRERFVGSWVGSMMTHMWVYDGDLDASGRVLTLYSDGPDFNDPARTLQYRDVIELEDEDRRVLRGSVLEADGTWKQFMTMHYRRAR